MKKSMRVRKKNVKIKFRKDRQKVMLLASQDVELKNTMKTLHEYHQLNDYGPRWRQTFQEVTDDGMGC